jgi:putative FmdB family regulatory protein
MPIYAYRCAECGHAKDVLQKLSDPALTVCPACGASAFSKQVTAAGFQLKGSGWYVTDFKGSSGGGKSASTPTSEGATESKSEPAKAEASASASGGAAAAGGCGGSCACH